MIFTKGTEKDNETLEEYLIREIKEELNSSIENIILNMGEKKILLIQFLKSWKIISLLVLDTDQQRSLENRSYL